MGIYLCPNCLLKPWRCREGHLTVSSCELFIAVAGPRLYFSNHFSPPKKMDKASANFSCLPSLKLT